jgi:hypothetical protein
MSDRSLAFITPIQKQKMGSVSEKMENFAQFEDAGSPLAAGSLRIQE